MNIDKIRLLVKELSAELGMRSDAGSDETVDDVVQQHATEIAPHPFVRGMRPEHLRMLAAQGVRARFEPDQMILKEANVAICHRRINT